MEKERNQDCDKTKVQDSGTSHYSNLFHCPPMHKFEKGWTTRCSHDILCLMPSLTFKSNMDAHGVKNLKKQPHTPSTGTEGGCPLNYSAPVRQLWFQPLAFLIPISAFT